jgi:hypothetical protein
MPLILAIEPDRRQAAQLSVVVRKRVHAELILVDTTERALEAIGNRIPDLVLVPALLSPQDDAALATALRVIATTARVQMLTIPVLGAAPQAPAAGGVLSALRRAKPRSAEPAGCDPAVFAEQLATYLDEAIRHRPTVDVERIAPIASAAATHEERPAGESIVTADSNAGITIEAPTEEWLAPSRVSADQSTTEDDGVTVALEEAVRALFADTPTPSDAGRVAAAPVSEQDVIDRDGAADDLLAALELIAWAPIEVWDDGEEIDLIADQPSAAPQRSMTDTESWVALVASLRNDVQRLRVEQPGRKAAPQPVRAERKAKPVQDEWGFFDPEQCGFAALLAKLDEVTESEDTPVKR